VYSDSNRQAADYLHILWTPNTLILYFLISSSLLTILSYGWINNVSCESFAHFVYSARPTSIEQSFVSHR